MKPTQIPRLKSFSGSLFSDSLQCCRISSPVKPPRYQPAAVAVAAPTNRQAPNTAGNARVIRKSLHRNKEIGGVSGPPSRQGHYTPMPTCAKWETSAALWLEAVAHPADVFAQHVQLVGK